MNPLIRPVLEKALQLTEMDRRYLINELLESLSTPLPSPDEQAIMEAEWEKVFEKRMQEMDSEAPVEAQ